MKKYHKNPRTLSQKQMKLLKSHLEELGDLSGVTHDLNTDEILTGNQRTEVFNVEDCKVEIVNKYKKPSKTGTVADGWIWYNDEKYYYRQVKWTPEQCEKANIVANLSGGSWDKDILSNMFDLDKLFEYGFEEHELNIDKTALKNLDDLESQIFDEVDTRMKLLSFYVPETVKRHVEHIIKFVTDGAAIIRSFPSVEIDMGKFASPKNVPDRAIKEEEAFYAFCALSFFNYLNTCRGRGDKLFKTSIVLNEADTKKFYGLILKRIKADVKGAGISRNPVNAAIMDLLRTSEDPDD